ncbi:MAG: hypothetical protein QW083_00630 [Methanomassiliicoccales archaeon]
MCKLQNSGIAKASILIGILWILQSAARLMFGVLGITDGMNQFLDNPISEAFSIFLLVIFMFLGIVGMIAAVGLLMRRKWGFWGILSVCLLTIAFDLWGLTIQFTAAIGLIVPIVSILFFMIWKSRLSTILK